MQIAGKASVGGAVVVVALIAALVSGCGWFWERPTTTMPPTTAVPATVPDHTAAAKANWMKFFDSATSAAEKAALLQNGDAHVGELEAFASNPLAALLTLPVTGVVVSGSTASLTYDVRLAGSTVAAGQTGTMVLENGVWKVSEATFIALAGQAASFGRS